MMLPEYVAAVMLVGLVVYTLTGGADFGGGVWDLLASGPRVAEQRRLIESAIAPVWEANHVWLIFVVVLLFGAFPPAFATVSTALFVPLSLALLGIVARGAAFVFRHYGQLSPVEARVWQRVFGSASLLTPVFLGVALGAVTHDPARWFTLFSLGTGVFVLTLFAFVGAVYLCVEAADPDLRDDFRRRALGTGILLGALSLTMALLARATSPRFASALFASRWSVAVQIVTGALAIAALAALWRRQFRLARVLAVAQSVFIAAGWGLAQHPFVVYPDWTLANAASPPATLRLLLIAVAAGAVVLLPSLYWLMRIFKSRAQTGE